MLRVVRNDSEPERERVNRHQGVKSADWLSTPSQCRRNQGEPIRGGLIEWNDRYVFDEAADGTVQLLRSLGLCPNLNSARVIALMQSSSGRCSTRGRPPAPHRESHS